VVFWYADRVVAKDSEVESARDLREMDDLRRSGKPLTLICNHLTYADSHVIETLLIRSGLRHLADHLIHIAGQKTFQISRRFLTRSLNTVRVYQPKARIDRRIKRKMNARALKWAARLKRRGYSLLVFPEGTRTRRRKRFNAHGANPKTIIYFRDSFVVPLALMGSENILPLGTILPRRATVRLRVGEPVDHRSMEESFAREHPNRTEVELRQALIHHYMNRINQLLDPDYRHGD
jgi:1-acyl-sn-glycerol-3-phosphate acyltransferase